VRPGVPIDPGCAPGGIVFAAIERESGEVLLEREITADQVDAAGLYATIDLSRPRG
jgi:hypothetical protein